MKLPPRSMVNILNSAFLNCVFSDRYSSKFDLKVSHSYLREYLFVALQSYVLFPLSTFFINLCLFFCLSFLFFLFSINSQCNMLKKDKHAFTSSTPQRFPRNVSECQCIFSLDCVLQNSFF